MLRKFGKCHWLAQVCAAGLYCHGGRLPRAGQAHGPGCPSERGAPSARTLVCAAVAALAATRCLLNAGPSCMAQPLRHMALPVCVCQAQHLPTGLVGLLLEELKGRPCRKHLLLGLPQADLGP